MIFFHQDPVPALTAPGPTASQHDAGCANVSVSDPAGTLPAGGPNLGVGMVGVGVGLEGGGWDHGQELAHRSRARFRSFLFLSYLNVFSLKATTTTTTTTTTTATKYNKQIIEQQQQQQHNNNNNNPPLPIPQEKQKNNNNNNNSNKIQQTNN